MDKPKTLYFELEKEENTNKKERLNAYAKLLKDYYNVKKGEEKNGI